MMWSRRGRAEERDSPRLSRADMVRLGRHVVNDLRPYIPMSKIFPETDRVPGSDRGAGALFNRP